jgi:sugar/nucleoside kinase (ribokinase family)
MAMIGEIDYLLIGHISADIAPGTRQLGGTVSYAAPTAQAFGLRVGVLTSAAVNEPLLQLLADFADVRAIPAAQTSTFENIYTGEFRTQMIRGVAEKILAEHIPDSWKSAPLVHIGPVADGVDPEIVHSFPNAMKILTPQGWLRQWGDDQQVRFKRWFDVDVLSAFDLVVLSEDDIAEAPELGQEIAEATRYCVVTRGSKGGTWYHQGKSFHYDAVQVDSQYLTGAGDVFAVSLMAAQHQLQGDMATAFRVAARLAAYATTRESVLDSAPTQEEVRAAFNLLKE